MRIYTYTYRHGQYIYICIRIRYMDTYRTETSELFHLVLPPDTSRTHPRGQPELRTLVPRDGGCLRHCGWHPTGGRARAPKMEKKHRTTG